MANFDNLCHSPYMSKIDKRCLIMTMNVSLTPELEKFVENKVKSGLYNSASEVVRESLRLLKRADEMEQIRLEELRQDIAVGIKELNEGKGIPFDVVRERVLKSPVKKMSKSDITTCDFK